MRRPWANRGGFTLLELSIAACFLVVLFGAAFVAIDREARTLSGLSRSASGEERAREFLARIESLLVQAEGFAPSAVLVDPLVASATKAVYLDALAAFPSAGTLVIDRGEDDEEHLDYAGFDPGETALTGLVRGLRCTEGASHAAGALVLWAGLGEPIAEQSSPPSGSFDGRSQELSGPTYFRGEGIGFCFRVPVDPSGGRDYLTDGEVNWGAEVAGTPTTDGWMALHFEPDAAFAEDGAVDVNIDGDREDTFDLGRLVLRTWNATDAKAGSVVRLTPPIVAQEECNWGGDLDGDGFDDPLFLWDENAGSLHVRLTTVTVTPGSSPLVHRAETMIFLRSHQAE